MSIDEHIGTVNSVIRSYARAAENNPAVSQMLGKLRGLSDFLAEQKRLATPIPKSLGDISDLPEELLRELSVTKTDELEDQILTVMRACDGSVNLDQVLVGLYRKFKVTQTRRYLQNKLYRMWKKELVYQVPGQRASYSLEPQPSISPPDKMKPKPNDLDEEIPF